MKRFVFVCLALIIHELVVSQQLQVIHISGYAQGTTYTVDYYDNQNRNFENDFSKILADFDLIFSGYDASSIVSQINRNEQNVKVDSLFEECYNRSMEIAKQTNGDFDITVGPLVNAWGFGSKQKIHMDSSKVDSLLQCIGYKDVALLNHEVVKKNKKIYLDFNAIAQGYSTDIVSRFLLSKGVSNFVVNIGGEVYAKGQDLNGNIWKISIELPYENTSDSLNPSGAILLLNGLAVSTSGNYRKFYIENGVKYSHEINPHTGYPAKNSLLSATIVAHDCASADAYATACMVMGLEKAILFLKKHSEIDALLYFSKPDGSIDSFKTKGLQTMIRK